MFNTDILIDVANSREQIEALRPFWTQMNRHPESHIDFVLMLAEARPEILRPQVLVVRRGSQPVAIMVGRVEDVPLDLGIGYKVLLRPKLRVFRIVHSGLFGEFSKAVHKALVSELLHRLRRHEVEAVALDFVPVDSGMFEVVRDLANPWLRNHFARANLHWQVKLAGSYNDYLGTLSKNTRKKLRKFANRINRDLGDSLSIRHLSQPDELDEILNAMEGVAVKTYQRGLGVGFKNDEETRRGMELALSQGCAHTYVLYVDGKPAAFDTGARCGDTIYLNAGGYDPDYASYSLGTFLLNRQIEEACENPAVRAIDFGLGDSSYKERFCNECWYEKSIFLFAPTLSGATLNLLRTSFSGGQHLLYASLKKAGVFEGLRKHLRQRKVSTTESSD